MIDLQQEYTNQNDPIAKVVKNTINNTKNIFANFSDSCKHIMANLDQQKVDVRSDDSINDKTLFAFLADFLKGFKDERNELFKELKRNKELTSQKLDLSLKEELRKNDFLTEENKTNIENFLNSQTSGDIVRELVANKMNEINNFTEEAQKRGMPQELIKDKLEDPRFFIRASDIAKVDLDNKILKDEQELTQTIKKAVLKK